MPRTAVPTENVNEVDIEEIVKIEEQIQIFVPPPGAFLAECDAIWEHYILDLQVFSECFLLKFIYISDAST